MENIKGLLLQLLTTLDIKEDALIQADLIAN
jgi:hypothetical protein